MIQSLPPMSVDNAVYPLLDEFEEIKNINPSKYSNEQFSEICSILEFKDKRLRIISYNLLFDINDHELNELDRWPNRFLRVIHLIKLIKPDIIGSQELQRHQINDLMQSLGDDYSFYGEPIVKEGKEYDIDGVFYLKRRFKLLNSETFFLGQLNYSHSVTQCHFKDSSTCKEFIVFNTHLPYHSPEQRALSTHFIVQKIKETNLPAILAGDLNTISQRMDYRGMPFFDGDFIKRILSSAGLVNSMDSSYLGHIGPISTFTNHPESHNAIPFAGTGVPGIILDHIYVSQGIKVMIHAIDPAKVGGRFPSDHLPVIVDLVVDS